MNLSSIITRFHKIRKSVKLETICTLFNLKKHIESLELSRSFGDFITSWMISSWTDPTSTFISPLHIKYYFWHVALNNYRITSSGSTYIGSFGSYQKFKQMYLKSINQFYKISKDVSGSVEYKLKGKFYERLMLFKRENKDLYLTNWIVLELIDGSPKKTWSNLHSTWITVCIQWDTTISSHSWFKFRGGIDITRFIHFMRENETNSSLASIRSVRLLWYCAMDLINSISIKGSV